MTFVEQRVQAVAELVQLQTGDGRRMMGALYAAQSPKQALGVVLVHGMTGSFIGEVESSLPPLLAEAGFSCLVFNNRGTGIIGAATERFADSFYDVQAGCDWMMARGFERLALVGHSKAAPKVCDYLDRTSDERVVGLAVLSPLQRVADIVPWQLPNLGGGRSLEEWLAEAQRRVEIGEGKRFFVGEQWPYLMSAETVCDHAACAVDTLQLLKGFQLPRFAACGDTELDWCTTVRSLLDAPVPGCQTEVIVGADHVYTGCEAALAEKLVAWLKLLG
ncbi:MAG: alpha/beta hydrolase [Anaerolinea sp.]|nr:alpha/beta hydrolase [Anaerolinea sp.]